MEKIKQAIEKAKGQANAPGTRSNWALPVRSEAPQNQAIDAIDYTATRVVPLNADHLERHRIAAYNKNSNMAWVFDLLRTQVLQKMEEMGWRTLAITSPTPEAGKTVVAINLAMSIAHHTAKTAMLVDFDLRRPKVGNYLGLQMDKSLNEFFSGEAELQDVLVNPGLPKLVVLPTKKPESHSSELLSSPKTTNLIADLRDRYESRIVIFDLPPILSADDAIAVLPKIDCVLMVVGNGMSTQQEIEDALRHLPQANLLGTVLNKAEAEAHPYYY
jgi:capsular exopolysaccharide synthesis family protein